MDTKLGKKHLFYSLKDVKSSYLRLLSLGFALLGRLHLLVVVLDKTRCQHIELLHPQWSGPLLGLLIRYLPETTGSVLILSGIWILLQKQKQPEAQILLCIRRLYLDEAESNIIIIMVLLEYSKRETINPP